MKLALPISLILMVNLNCQFARADWLSEENPAPYFRAPFTSAATPSFNRANDTSNQQGKVLEKINQALSRGAISAEQASDFKDELNKINEKEGWHKSYGQAIPIELLKDDQQRLSVLSAKLDQISGLTSASAPADAVHLDVHKLISQALAKNKISNAQAEQYYARLAQIEADMESLAKDPAASKSETIAEAKELEQLKDDLQRNH